MSRKLEPAHILILLFLSYGVLFAIPANSSPETDTAMLFIYLEVPSDYSLPTTLTVADLELRNESGAVRLEPKRRNLATEKLAGKQILLARTRLAAGYYDTLIVELAKVATQMGEALVEPPTQSGGYVVALDVQLVAGEATTINLIWQPGLVPAAGNPYEMNLQVAHFPRPPLGSLVFVTERQTGSVMIVDRPGARVVDAITVGENPGGMAYSAQRQKLYVAVSGADALGVVDGLTLRLERLVPLSFGDEPDRLALAPDESVLYVLNEGSRSLAAIATRSMQEQYRTTVGDGPRSLAVDPRTGYIYVACEYEGEVQVFNPAGLTPLSSLLLTAAPVEVIIAETDRELFVASSSQNRIHGQNLDDGRELGAMSLCGPARYLIHNSRSSQLLAAIPSCDEIAVLRPANGLEFAPFSLLDSPGQMTFDSGRRQLLIIFGQKATLGIYDANRGSVVGVVELGGRPHAVVAP